ncbi:MAG: competence protein ComEC, partial [Glaciecola sp.]
MTTGIGARADVGPMGVWAVAGLLGAFVGSSHVLPTPATWAVGLIGLAAGALAGTTRWALLRTGAVAVAIAAALLLSGQLRLCLENNGPLLDLAARGGEATLEATVVSEPRVTEDGWWVLLRMSQIDSMQARNRAMLRGQGDPPALWSRWQSQATARPLDDARPFDAWLRTLHAVAEATPTGTATWSQPGLLGSLTEEIRSRIRRGAGVPGSDRAGLVVGLATGDTRGISRETEGQLRDAGLSHLTAVSGSNVALVVAATLMLVGAFPIGPVGRHALIASAVVGFAVLTRFEPSVLRASVMVAVLGLAGARRTIGDGRHALSSAVVILLLVDPMLSRSLGLLLSAGAAAGILLLVPRLDARLGTLPRWLRTPLAVTLAAQLGVAPILLLVESEVGLTDIPANLLAVPLAMIASLVGGAGAVLSVAHPVFGAPLLSLATIPASGILRIARVFADAGPVLALARPLSLLAVVAGCMWLLSLTRSRTGRWSAAVAVVLGVATLAPVRVSTPSTLEVVVIDVGQGDAILVQAPDGTRILVDAGPDDAALEWLRRRGIDRLDLAVLTHPHLDHVGGMPAVLERLDVGALWLRPVPSALPEAEAVAAIAARKLIEVAEPHTGQRAQLGEVTLEVLGPDRGRPFAHGEREINDSSIVLRVSWRGRTALLTGDAEHAAQQAMLAHPERLRAGLLKVPHHGGSTSEPDFLRAVAARVAVISVGAGNSYGHPREDVLAQLKASGAQIRRTDQEGTLSVAVPAVGDELAPGQGRAAVGQPTWRPTAVGSPGSQEQRHGRGRSRHPDHGGRRSSAPARVRVGPRR